MAWDSCPWCGAEKMYGMECRCRQRGRVIIFGNPPLPPAPISPRRRAGKTAAFIDSLQERLARVTAERDAARKECGVLGDGNGKALAEAADLVAELKSIHAYALDVFNGGRISQSISGKDPCALQCFARAILTMVSMRKMPGELTEEEFQEELERVKTRGLGT